MLILSLSEKVLKWHVIIAKKNKFRKLKKQFIFKRLIQGEHDLFRRLHSDPYESADGPAA